MEQPQLNQLVEHDVRHLIGDLQIQIIVLRNMLNLSQQQIVETAQQQPQANGHDTVHVGSAP